MTPLGPGSLMSSPGEWQSTPSHTDVTGDVTRIPCGSGSSRLPPAPSHALVPVADFSLFAGLSPARAHSARHVRESSGRALGPGLRPAPPNTPVPCSTSSRSLENTGASKKKAGIRPHLPRKPVALCPDDRGHAHSVEP